MLEFKYAVELNKKQSSQLSDLHRLNFPKNKYPYLSSMALIGLLNNQVVGYIESDSLRHGGYGDGIPFVNVLNSIVTSEEFVKSKFYKRDWFDINDQYISFLGVDDDERLKGYGSLLLNKSIDNLFDLYGNNVSKIFCLVNCNNPSDDFWIKNYFVKICDLENVDLNTRLFYRNLVI